MSVTLRVTPSAASSSSEPRPAGVAGTLIMRFLWPLLHFLPSSMYCFVRSARRHVAVRVFQQRIQLEADVAVVALRLLPHRQERPPGPAGPAGRSWPRRAHRPAAPRGGAGTIWFSKRPVSIRSRDDDRVRGRPGGAEGAVRGDLVRVDRIEPHLGAARDQGLQGGGHGPDSFTGEKHGEKTAVVLSERMRRSTYPGMGPKKPWSSHGLCYMLARARLCSNRVFGRRTGAPDRYARTSSLLPTPRPSAMIRLSLRRARALDLATRRFGAGRVVHDPCAASSGGPGESPRTAGDQARRPHLHHRQHARRPDAARRLAGNLLPQPLPQARPGLPQPRLLRRRADASRRLRSQSFGTPDQWLAGSAPVPEPNKLVTRHGVRDNRFETTNTRADVVFAFFGYNESFAGAGRPRQVQERPRRLHQAHPGAEVQRQERPAPRPLLADRATRISRDRNLPDGKREQRAAGNVHEGDGRSCHGQRASRSWTCSTRRTTCTRKAAKPLTINGVHLNERGNEAVAKIIDAALFAGAGGETRRRRRWKSSARPSSTRTSTGSTATASWTATTSTAAGPSMQYAGQAVQLRGPAARAGNPRRDDRQPRQAHLGRRAGQGPEGRRQQRAAAHPGRRRTSPAPGPTASTSSSTARRPSRR